ncbi:unnamed protein product, partial [marine sediment metagenome]
TEGQLKMVRFLIERGADINMRHPKDVLPLQAAFNGYRRAPRKKE